MSEGHAHARHYPLAVLWSEARIVRQRRADRMRIETTLLQTAMSSILSKQGGRVLKRLLKKLDEVT